MKNNNTLESLEAVLQYTFVQKEILQAALTHTSAINELNINHNSHNLHNERLEFLGDAVLELIISEELFTRYQDLREGALTHSRSKLVNEEILAKMARMLELNEYIFLGKGEESQGGRERPSILSDAFEAILAAIYTDAAKNPRYTNPLEPVRALILRLYRDYWSDTIYEKKAKDYKTLLQERTQSIYKDTPKYALISTSGPEHNKLFTVELLLPNGEVIQKSAKSKKLAEQQAAEDALKMLDA